MDGTGRDMAPVNPACHCQASAVMGWVGGQALRGLIETAICPAERSPRTNPKAKRARYRTEDDRHEPASNRAEIATAVGSPRSSKVGPQH